MGKRGPRLKIRRSTKLNANSAKIKGFGQFSIISKLKSNLFAAIAIRKAIKIKFYKIKNRLTISKRATWQNKKKIAGKKGKIRLAKRKARK